jgi:ectoine hydroxylase-related dioxygenase (phytanoyl-CoA dioxygenase family)
MMGYRDIILNDGYTIIPEFLDRADLKKVVDLERNTSPWKGLHKEFGWQNEKIFDKQEYVHYWSVQVKKQTHWLQEKLHPIVSDIMQTNYKWFLVDFHTTNPGSDYILAHIDTPYQFRPWNHITELIAVQCLIAVDDFTHESGATRLIAGSHREQTLVEDIGSKELDDKLLAEGSDFVAPAGSVVIYHPRTIHSTMPNMSNKPRSALLLCAVRPDLIDSLVHYQPQYEE